MKQSAEKKAAAKQYENDIAARNEQREYDRGALLRLVEDAEGAGFNPLTVLRNGGTAYQNSGAPLLSRREVGGSPVGDALGNVANFLENFDPHADTKREQSYRLVESQIASLNAGTLSRAPGSAARSVRRSYATSDYERRPSGKAASLGKPSKWEAGDVTVTNPFREWAVDPTVADASAWEERYGDSEIGSTLYGGWIAYKDLMLNADRQLSKPWKAKPQYSKHLIRKPAARSGGGGW